MTNKISLIQPASGFNLAAINSNFQKIEDEFNDKVLYRDNPDGEANTLENDIDANGFTIYNISDLVVNGSITLNGTDFGALESAAANVQTLVDEAESYADEAWASAALIADWSYEGTWTTAVAYEKNNLVNVPSGTYEGWTFIALSNHTAGATFDADYLGGKWGIIAKRGNSGAGTGDLIAANNLFDVADAAAARMNLGAHNASNITTGTLPLTYGGTGANTASGARSSLGISATGDSIVTAASVSAVKTVLGTLTDFQNQTGKAYTTAGTSSAFTLTPSPAVTSYAENQEFDVEFNAASTGTPTLDISGLGAKSLKFRGPTGALVSVGTRIPSGWRSKVTYDGADMIVREMPPAPSFYFGNGWINAGSFNSSSFTSLYVATTSVSNNSGFSSGTVTVPYSGWYEVICPRMSYSYISGTVTSVDFRVGHNGSNINPEFSLTADTQRMAFHVVFAVTAGDTVEFRGRVTGGGTVGYSLVGVQMRMLS